MPNIKYSLEHAPTLKAFTQDDSFIRGIMGAFGSGKSSVCSTEILARAMKQEPNESGVRKTRWACIRNTYKQLDDTTIKTFDQWVPMHTLGQYKVSEHTFRSNDIPLDDGTIVSFEVLFRALDKPEHVKNLLSLELTGAWVNEARDVPKAIIDALQGRVGRYPSKMEGGASWYGIWLDTNPPDDDSWWYKLFEEDAPENCKLFKQPSGLSDEAENLPFLPDGYYENMAVGKDKEFVNVYIHGKYGFVKDGKPVFPDYSDEIHCKDFLLPLDIDIYRGWDFGLTPACNFSFINAEGQWCVFDEMVTDNMGIDRFSDQVLTYSLSKYPDHKFIDIGDPAGNQRSQTDERTCFDILIGKNINIIGGDQDPNIRIESVKYPLNRLTEGKPNFLLHPRCKMLRKGFNGKYQYRRLHTSKEKYLDKPDKNEFSHIHDSLQYTATYLFANRLRGVSEYKETKSNLLPTFDELMKESSNKRNRI